MIRMTEKRMFVSFTFCPGFQDLEAVRVLLAEVPVPGNLFGGQAFLPEGRRAAFNNGTHAFFVKDVEHRFDQGFQDIIILLAIAPRSLMTAVKSARN